MELTPILVIVLVIYGVYNFLTRKPKKEVRDANGMKIDPRDDYYCYASYDAIDEGRDEADAQDVPEEEKRRDII
ncbi:MAG: hypothetical protein IJ461_02660 [Clostridia bacterium]|nr:hypothetical protein [Clostridia bacterium]